jgi:hypothetical protein
MAVNLKVVKRRGESDEKLIRRKTAGYSRAKESNEKRAGETL